MREEEDVGVFKRLVDVPVSHEFLVSELMESLLFLVLGEDLGRDELDWLGDDLGNYKFELLDGFVHLGNPLQRGNHKVFQEV